MDRNNIVILLSIGDHAHNTVFERGSYVAQADLQPPL